MQEISRKEIKGYELVERIGAGGFGAVYRAHQSTVGREVAIKVILPGYANQPEFIRRFEAEAQLVARLEHHHIVPLYDYWRDPEGAYLVMRWLRGGSLYDQIQNHGSLSIEEATSVIDQIAGALHTAHRSQVIHRDIKPGNILLDEDGNAFVADFGIAKDHAMAKGVTEADAIVGSPDYLSPEQARSEAVTPQTDIYSLGVVLYEMLEGKHPFPGLSPIERLYKHLNEPLPEVDSVDKAVKDAINEVIQKATAKDPMQRFKDVMEMALALREAARLDDTTVGTTLVELLTPREQEVLNFVIAGKSNREIADDLVLSLATVKTYINKIYRKLNVRSRVQAIVKARELDLIVQRSDTYENSGSQLPEPENPYKGLRAFQSADSQDFFGREKLIRKLLRRLQEDVAYRRFLAVVGPSGSGKSSVVKAGLVPALWRGEISGSENWYIIDFLPGRHPLDELEVALTKVASQDVSNLNEHLNRDERGLVRAANIILPDDGSELLIVIDQFEEVFTLMDDEQERKQFLDLLRYASTDDRSRVRVVVTLRADYYDRPLQFPDLGKLIQERTETVLPLNAEELEHAIRQPAMNQGITFDDGLVSKIVADVHYQPGALPLLQYALTELFEHRDGRKLTLKAYQDIGGTAGALAKRADEIYQESNSSGHELIRQLFLRLVTLGEGAEDTRRRVERSELLAVASNADMMDEIIDLYANSRLLSLDNDLETRRPTVEVAHEAILREWDRLRQWLNESREDIRQERSIARSSEDWHEHDRDLSYLLRGTRLEQTEKWLQSATIVLTPLEQEFISQSLAQRTSEREMEIARSERETLQENRSRTLLRVLVLVLTLATIVSGGLAVIANIQRNLAVNQTNVVQSLLLSQGAEDAFDNRNPEQAVALAIAASRFNNAPPEAFQILSQVATSPGVVQRMHTEAGAIEWLRVPATGDHVISASTNIISIWNIHTGEERRLEAHDSFVTWIDVNTDGTLLASSDTEGNVFIWDWQTGEQIQHIITRFPTVAFARFVPNTDGTLIVNSTPEWDFRRIIVGESELVVYDAISGEEINNLNTPQAGLAVEYLNFSADGQTIVVRHRSIEPGPPIFGIVVWDLVSGTRVYEQVFSDRPLYFPSLAPFPQSIVSPSGEYLLLSMVDLQTNDVTVELVETSSGETIYSFWEGQSNRLNTWFEPSGLFAFIQTDDGYDQFDLASYELVNQYEVGAFPSISSQGNHILFDDDGRSVTVVDILTGEEIIRYDFSTDDESTALSTLSADGNYIVTGDATGEIRLWSIFPDIEVFRYSQHQMPALVAEFVPDSQYVLSASGVPPRSPEGYGELHLWNASTGEIIQQFDGHNSPIWGLAVSPNGDVAISSALDGSIIAWNLQSGEAIWEIQLEPERIVERLTFNTDGTILLGGLTNFNESVESTPEVVMWDSETGIEIRRYDFDVPLPHGGVTAVAMSPDGESALASVLKEDGSILIWFRLDTGEVLLQTPISLARRTDGLAFHPDGTRALTGSVDNAVRLWNLETGVVVQQFDGHTSPVQSVGISSDGNLAVSGSGLPGVAGESDDVVIIWDIVSGEEVQRFEGHNSVVKHVAFSPDSLQVVSASPDSTVRIWNIITWRNLEEWVYENRYVRNLTCTEQRLYLIADACD